MWYALFRLLHFIALFTFAGALVIQTMVTGREISRDDARQLARIDIVAGLAVAGALAFGLVLWLIVGKPATFYSTNPVFHVKLALFGLLLICALIPFRFFRRHSALPVEDNAQAITVPPVVRLLLRLELALIILMVIVAFLMARGIGLSA